MLVLSRKAGERLIIGPNIVLTVLEIRGSVVKLGCDAPLTIPIRREKLAQRPTGRNPEPKRQPTESPSLCTHVGFSDQ